MSVSELPKELHERGSPHSEPRSERSGYADSLPRYRTEIPIAILGLLALALAVYGQHIKAGGFWFDDWRVQAATQHLNNVFSAHGALSAVGLNVRPLSAIALATMAKLFGQHQHYYLLASVFLAVATSTALYAVVRESGGGRIVAGGAAALLLVFPWADASPLWPAAAQNQAALFLVLLGAWAGLRALRGGWGWIVAAVAAYVLSLLWYDETAGLVVGAVVLVAIRGRNRRALVHGVAAIAATGITAAIVESSGQPQAQSNVAGVLRHSRTILDQSWQLLGSSLMPADSLWRIGSFLAVAVVVVAVVLQARLAPDEPQRDRLRRGLLVVAAGVFAIALGYGPIAVAIDWYIPLQPGQGTRTNTAAAVGWALLAVGLVMLLVAVGAYVLQRTNRTATRSQVQVALVAAVALVAIGWATRTAAQARDWDEASQIQRGVLGLISASTPAPPANSTFVLFGAPRATQPEIPVFLLPADLGAALQVWLHRQDVTGWPINGATVVSCGATGPVTTGGWIAPESGARYGATYFVDYANARVLPVPNAKTCKQELATLHAGPMYEFQ